MVSGEPEAGRGADPDREAEDAPKARARDTPTLETEGGDLAADPGVLTVWKPDLEPVLWGLQRGKPEI